MLRFGLQWLSPPGPLSGRTFQVFYGRFACQQGSSRLLGTCPWERSPLCIRGDFPPSEQAEKHPVWKLGLVEENRRAQRFGEGCLMLVHSPGIWVHFLALQKASCPASGRSLHLGARFLPCNGKGNPFHQLPVIKDARVPQGGGRRLVGD